MEKRGLLVGSVVSATLLCALAAATTASTMSGRFMPMDR